MSQGIVETSQGSGSSSSSGASRSKLVQRLLDASANLPAFVQDLLTTQAVVVAGTEASGFIVEKSAEDFTLRPIAHIRPDQSNAETRAAAIAAFQEIIRPCIEQNKDGAIEITASSDDAGESQFCLVTLLRNEGEIVAASAVITRCRNIERAQQRLMSMQLVAGYFDFYSLRRTSEQSRVIAQSHQHVLQLATAVATAEGFNAAAMNLCNELALRSNAARVSVGWIKGNRVRVKALSHTEKFDKKQELIVDLERAMEECLDQEQIVHFDPVSGDSSETVTRSAQTLSQKQGGHTVLSLPLRRRGEIIGVVTLEFPSQNKLGPNVASGLAVAVDLLAPQLYDRYQNDRWLITKTGMSIRETAKLAIGPKHMLAKLVIVLLLGVVLFVSFYDAMHKVTAPFQFIPIEKRIVAAPYEAKLKEVHVRPGDRVAAGQVLIELDTTELQLRKNQAEKEAMAKFREMESHRGENKISEMKIAEAERAYALEQAKLLEHQIQQGRIVAPIDGIVMQGELKDRIGAPVRQGDVLLEVGEQGQLRAELAVAERDIQYLHEGGHQIGRLATGTEPTQRVPFRIERIVPLGEARDADNVFKVYATIDHDSPDWTAEMDKWVSQWRPGMMGEAKVHIAEKPLLWIGTHRLVNWVRLKLWL